jgi:hypothetical protein
MKKITLILPLMFLFNATYLQAQCPDSLIKNAILSPLKCYGDSNAIFSISLSAKAVEPVKYIYKNEAMDTVFTKDFYIYNLKAGKYSCTVTDAKGCRDSIKVAIKQPEFMSVDLQTLQCDDGSGNGKIKGIVRVADSTYTYRWDTGDTILSRVKAGERFWVTVKNSNGCEYRDRELMFKCGQKECNYLIINDLLVTDVDCFGGFDGSVSIVLKDSLPYPLSISLYNDKYQFMSNDFPIYYLPAGIYNYVVKDARGCMDSLKFAVKQPKVINIDMRIVNCDDGSENGAIKAFVQVGDSSYIHRWVTGDTILRNLKAGQYTPVYISDGICQSVFGLKMTRCTTTKTEDLSENIHIYPNPVSDKIFIESPFRIEKVEILDVTGRIISVFNEKDLKEIPLSNLQFGSYFIKFYALKCILVKKFIKF